jgi:hypothetical protein
MSDTPRIVIVSPSGILPKETRDLRARAWSYIFGCYEKRKAAGEDGGEDYTKHAKNEGRPA